MTIMSVMMMRVMMMMMIMNRRRRRMKMTMLMMWMMMMMTNLAGSNIVHPSNPELIFNSFFQARDFLVVIIY